MPDLLVRLYDLLPNPPSLSAGWEIRRALPPERHVVLPWVKAQFSPAWESECAAAFARLPVSCFLAVHVGKPGGFVVYEATCRNFLGPLGVADDHRGKNVGSALLWHGLDAMRAQGYGYAIIGAAGPIEFFRKKVGATVIEGSEPGIYRGMMRGASHS